MNDDHSRATAFREVSRMSTYDCGYIDPADMIVDEHGLCWLRASAPVVAGRNGIFCMLIQLRRDGFHAWPPADGWWKRTTPERMPADLLSVVAIPWGDQHPYWNTVAISRRFSFGRKRRQAKLPRYLEGYLLCRLADYTPGFMEADKRFMDHTGNLWVPNDARVMVIDRPDGPYDMPVVIRLDGIHIWPPSGSCRIGRPLAWHQRVEQAHFD